MVYIVLQGDLTTTKSVRGALPPVRPRTAIAAGALAFAVADLLIGFTAFSSIALATLWVFALGWIQLHSEFLAHGLGFGTALQLGLAWFGAVIALPMLGLTIYLATRALTLPHRLYYMVRGGVRPAAGAPPAGLGGNRLPTRGLRRTSYVAEFWTGG